MTADANTDARSNAVTEKASTGAPSTTTKTATLKKMAYRAKEKGGVVVEAVRESLKRKTGGWKGGEEEEEEEEERRGLIDDEEQEEEEEEGQRKVMVLKDVEVPVAGRRAEDGSGEPFLELEKKLDGDGLRKSGHGSI